MQVKKEKINALGGAILEAVRQEYPHGYYRVVEEEKDLRPHKQLHPAFYGSFDWHSAVHCHWALVKLLQYYPEALTMKSQIREVLTSHLTKENILAEVQYVKKHKSFERPYGWVWVLQLAGELKYLDVEGAQTWRENVQPLEQLLLEKVMKYFSQLEYPVRAGTHSNSAFALSLIYDYAQQCHNERVIRWSTKLAKEFFLECRDYPFRFEPSAGDFLSPGLTQADLMRRVLSRKTFHCWFQTFLPQRDEFEQVLQPVRANDPSDPSNVHLLGLNLSRAWNLRNLAQCIREEELKETLFSSAKKHANKCLQTVPTGEFMADHWLPSFIIYYFTSTNKSC